jgi:hypothetical protein
MFNENFKRFESHVDPDVRAPRRTCRLRLDGDGLAPMTEAAALGPLLSR